MDRYRRAIQKLKFDIDRFFRSVKSKNRIGIGLNRMLSNGDPFLLSPEPEDRWVNAPQLVRADAGSQQGHPFLLSPDPEDRWVNAPRLVGAVPDAQYSDPFLLSPEPEDRWVNAPQLVRADPASQYGDPVLFSPDPEDRWINAPRGLTRLLSMAALFFSHLSLRIGG
jgi:hypothetical protein